MYDFFFEKNDSGNLKKWFLDEIIDFRLRKLKKIWTQKSILDSKSSKNVNVQKWRQNGSTAII